MDQDSGHCDVEKLRLERNLYLRLLELGAETELEPFLEEALALVVEIAGAEQGYLELEGASHDGEQVWSTSHGFSCSELEDVRSRISCGIIADVLSTGQIVNTSSAMLDPRYSERRSVHDRRIEAVLCAPIGSAPSLGAIYLQGRKEKGPFPDDDCERATLFARHLVPLADNFILRHRVSNAEDETAPFRQGLKADGLIGRSGALGALLREISLVAPLDVNVLLTGESGTGKSQVARIIHESGSRAGKPMLEINCAALPEALLENELFGAQPGAHSTAMTARSGKVAAAKGGTLLLDEISELPLVCQASLLQLLQTRQYYPLGANKPETADVRIIAATNVDLEAAVCSGKFREDLYFRLVVLPIRVPTLAERADDVPELARYFCARVCEKHGLPRLEFSLGGLAAVEAAEWPGNIRQLDHAIEAGAIRAAGGGSALIEQQHVFPDVCARVASADAAMTLQEATRRFQAGLLRKTLDEADWNISETARRLDVSRPYVYKLMSGFEIKREDA
jgi:Nif-specific regulatory protein